jgi:hypothetical protein
MIRLSDILSSCMARYLQSHKLSYKQQKVVKKITSCCTEDSRKVIFECSNEKCKSEEIFPQPCRDRHCNRCNNNKKLKWLKKQLEDHLPLPYYHVVFTLPSELHNLAICNAEIIYNIFFQSSFYVLKKFGKDPKYFGGEIGFTGLLHTWGQRLNYHPHIHYVVLAGGIRDGKYKKLPYQNKFIFPVQALSVVMMGRFIKLLKEKYFAGELRFPGKLNSIATEQKFNNFLYQLSIKEWVVFSKKPFAQSEKVFEYISRYTHRVAISNYRIKEFGKGNVSFEYLDYKDKNKKGVPLKKTLKLADMEFIRRFLLHVLPDGFRKIRYGGIFSSNRKAETIATINNTLASELEELLKKSSEIIKRLEKQIVIVCQKCSSELLPKKLTSLSGYI